MISTLPDFTATATVPTSAIAPKELIGGINFPSLLSGIQAASDGDLAGTSDPSMASRVQYATKLSALSSAGDDLVSNAASEPLTRLSRAVMPAPSVPFNNAPATGNPLPPSGTALPSGPSGPSGPYGPYGQSGSQDLPLAREQASVQNPPTVTRISIRQNAQLRAGLLETGNLDNTARPVSSWTAPDALVSQGASEADLTNISPSAALPKGTLPKLVDAPIGFAEPAVQSDEDWSEGSETLQRSGANSLPLAQTPTEILQGDPSFVNSADIRQLASAQTEPLATPQDQYGYAEASRSLAPTMSLSAPVADVSGKSDGFSGSLIGTSPMSPDGTSAGTSPNAALLGRANFEPAAPGPSQPINEQALSQLNTGLDAKPEDSAPKDSEPKDSAPKDSRANIAQAQLAAALTQARVMPPAQAGLQTPLTKQTARVDGAAQSEMVDSLVQPESATKTGPNMGTGPLAAPAVLATADDPQADPNASRGSTPTGFTLPGGPASTTSQAAQAPLDPASLQQSTTSPQAAAPIAQQPSLPIPLADTNAAFRLSPQLENTIDQLVETRSMAQANRPELTVRHQEFGAITMRLDTSGGDLRATLSARDPGFVPAIQTALAERSIAPSSETSGASTQRGNEQANSQSGSSQNGQGQGQAQGQTQGQGQGQAQGQTSYSGGGYGSSTGSGQGTSQPYTGQIEDRDKESGSDQGGRRPGFGDGRAGDGEIFA